MIEYLLLKVRLGDWHGVRDAASDLELMEARTGARPTTQARTWTAEVVESSEK